MADPLDLQPSQGQHQAKTVLDWNHRVLGTLSEGPSRKAAGDLGLLSIHLGSEAQDALGAQGEDVEVPSSLVCSIRRDQIVLDRSIEDLATELRKDMARDD